jgi:hypothetical protein
VTTKRFTAEIYQGHTTDCGVIVPFDAAKVWKTAKPLPIGYRKHVGYAVRGTVNGKAFESWVFHYFHEWRMVVPEKALDAAGVGPEETAKFALSAHPDPESVKKFEAGPKRR